VKECLELSIVFLKSFATRLSRSTQAKNRATTQRRVMTAKPTWLPEGRTTWLRMGVALATRAPA
jgi:hypothetical protein